MDRKHRIMDYLNSLEMVDLVQCYNDYAEANNYERIFPLELIDEFESTEGRTFSQIVKAGKYINFDDIYFIYTPYGIESFTYADDKPSPIFVSEIADYIDRNDDDFGYADIREILEENE